MSLDDVTRFWQLFDEARGDLAIRQIEKRARASRGRIGNAYSAKRQPSRLVIESIADGLGLDRREVLSWAKILPPPPDDEQRKREDELTYLFRHMTPHEQELMLIQFRAVVRELPRESNAETEAIPRSDQGESTPARV